MYRSSKVEKDKESGVAALELALILPLLLIMAFGAIDFGRLIHARLIVTNVSREGGSLASREFKVGSDLLTMLQASGQPLDLNGSGRIWVTKIRAGTSENAPWPSIVLPRWNAGSLNVSSTIREDLGHLGLSSTLYDRLVFQESNGTSDIAEVWVVEVFYMFRPITPLPEFAGNILLRDGGGIIIGSKAVF